MNRAVRRHPGSTKEPAKGRANVRPFGRSGGRTATARSGKRGLAGLSPQWITDIVSELRKVVWPERQEALYLTMVVVVVAAFLGGLLGGLDIAFGWIVDKVLLR